MSPRVFVTGGSGFIGQRVLKKLVERGYQVRALARSKHAAEIVQALGAAPVWGDITAIESMREGMRACDGVFHLAGWYRLGAADAHRAESTNVDGTQNVFSLAFELGISRIVFTSTLAVYGNTQGQLPDETYQPPGGPFASEYERTKWQAQYQVAMPFIRAGAPIIIVMPGAVYGPDDPSLIGEMMRMFYRGFFPVLPGPALTLAWAHVDDIAEGHLLAYEKGRPGESYILAGEILTLHEAVRLWSQASGRRAPLFAIPAAWIKPLAPLAPSLQRHFLHSPLISQDAIAMLDACYIGSGEKARRELGWSYRPAEQGFCQTFAKIAREESARKQAQLNRSTPELRRQVAAIALGAALGLLVAWLAKQRRRR